VVADTDDTLPLPATVSLPPAGGGGAPPIVPLAPAVPIPGQVILKDDGLCGICEQPLICPTIGDQESLIGLACTDPISHVFHASCLKDWRTSNVPDLTGICPQCNVNPMHAITRRVASQVVKTRIKKKRASCWRHFWAEWARQQTVVLIIMMAVGMGLIIFKVLEEWIRNWSDRTEL